jgi:hypothetical protein
MLGLTVAGVGVGIRSDLPRDSKEQKKLDDSSSSLCNLAGSPLFLGFESGGTFIFNEDDFLGSIVLRHSKLSMTNPFFLEALDEQDRLGERTRPKSIVDIASEVGISSDEIVEISAYRLPVNYYSAPINYDVIGECLISIRCFSAELVIAAGIYGNDNGRSISDIRVTRWSDLEEASVQHLECFLSLRKSSP